MTTAVDDKKVKLILHCENGSPPYLTPALLATCFPPTSLAVRDHLVFGIAVRDSCVTPVYEPKEKKSKKTKQKSGSKINPPSRQGSAMSDASNSSAKPTGYTFTGRPLHEHLIIPREYNVLACPSFDLIDDAKSGNSNMMKAATATHKEVSLVTPRGHQKLTFRSRRALVLDVHGWRDEKKDEEDGESRSKKRPRTDGATCTSTSAGATDLIGNDGCICLEEKSFARDTASFVGGCSCLACTEHSRAYVHHLINAKELLAEILLFVHNLHHLLSLLQEMNDATNSGRQMEFLKHMERQLLDSTCTSQ